MKHKKAGQVRSSEIITTFGPGSIFNGKEGVSVMILGLDAWPEAFIDSGDLSKFQVIHNKFLEDVCKKDHFRMPSNDGGFGGGGFHGGGGGGGFGGGHSGGGGAGR